jgi:hypothetical protein
VSPDERLAAVYAELRALGLPCLVMGGHAARFFGVDRMTRDYDLHVALDPAAWQALPRTLAASALFGPSLREGPSWRPDDFRRFVIGRLPDGGEERLECWRRNHLLAPFVTLHARREEGHYGGRRVAFLGLDDLLRSKETEREDDWRDVALLEEIADERRFARAGDRDRAREALSGLRSRRGYERAAADGWLRERTLIDAAADTVRISLASAFLAPHRPEVTTRCPPGTPPSIVELVEGSLRRVAPGSGRHLALVEAVRRLYRRAAMAADRADKERSVRA